ncbi:SCAN domain-containing protein 3 [Trichinella zimbabwensis]|uniref:SCAN domain-containing protein 3 n=1 Tax=Trichinella zimbabwensis TaxID=268475 RepID=A0A0V1GXL9_9BILA|nr:SCAN domain-containing protein 3 [Trichinella zimbabwensis]
MASDGALAMVCRYRRFATLLKETVPDVRTAHCVLRRHHLVAMNFSREMHAALKVCIKAVNKIKGHLMNCRRFAMLCEKNDETFNQLLVHTEFLPDVDQTLCDKLKRYEASRNPYGVDDIKRFPISVKDRRGRLADKIVEVAHCYECLLKATSGHQSKRHATAAEIIWLAAAFDRNHIKFIRALQIKADTRKNVRYRMSMFTCIITRDGNLELKAPCNGMVCGLLCNAITGTLEDYGNKKIWDSADASARPHDQFY